MLEFVEACLLTLNMIMVLINAIAFILNCRDYEEKSIFSFISTILCIFSGMLNMIYVFYTMTQRLTTSIV